MLFEQEKIEIINDGLSRLSYFFNGLTEKEDDVIKFSETFEQLFYDFKNKSKFKNENNLDFLLAACFNILNFEHTINKDIQWRKEETEEEMLRSDPYFDEYYSAYNNAVKVDEFLLKSYPHKFTPMFPENGFILFEPIKFDRINHIPTKSEKLYQKLSEHGFFDLEKVKTLSVPNQKNLFELINEKNIVYRIAMFDFLDYLKYLEKEYFHSKRELHKNLSSWFDSDKDGRTIKGNINALVKKPEKNDRYKSYSYKEVVKKHYNNLK